MPELIPSDEPESTEPDQDAPTSVRDSWWWSPTVSIIIGIVIVSFQASPIRSGDGFWLNWVVAGLGIALSASGVVRLVRAYPR
ncbi:hypothetical protein [Pengzhenrongella sp.]|jgi:hypothetical protein|uniref:hypothetical protein n=1 Tax=Pengzhenrongella sp. TaxID=2888820 RepID=UPI002F91C2BC